MNKKITEEIFNGSFICPVLYDEYVIPSFPRNTNKGIPATAHRLNQSAQ